ncbi:aminotransferase [Rhodobacteraceae bacterium 2CG4]|uniref:aspartate transaminase n=1 Tax=Halovulum marinum TaxID=2662447 RepID=A0A6L5Z058_9RHOB|nr:aminotransferase [Halovulum marinum]MSU89907.1 aminotransferase [Halovulum marinum]
MTKISRQLAAAFPPPVMEARAWAAAARLPADLPLLNVSQAAPVDPPPQELRRAIADAALHDAAAHGYGPVLGLPALRAEIAAQWAARYRGRIAPDNVAITSGCNQAFCAAVASLADAGEAVILPTPWYFNHKMWLDMAGVEARLLPCDAGMVPDPERAEGLIDARVKAIVLVTPNNPTGAEYPAGVIAAFADLARRHGIALILDETYRDFHSADGAPHGLFAGDWQDVLIHLYSFSKVFRLTGHRVGAMICGAERLAEIEKFLDTMTICPNQLGQRAALFGLQHLGDWVAAERAEILRRRDAVRRAFAGLDGWRLLGLGAYFAYLEHPWQAPSDRIAQRLVAEAGVLLLPGTMFAPKASAGGDGSAERQLRIAFANADTDGIDALAARLRGFAT